MSSLNNESLCATGCGKLGSLRCSRCLIALYGGQDCQKKAWPSHKGPCKETAAKKMADDIQTLCAAGCGEIALERCSLCAGAKYCGRKCQKKHWPQHKEACKNAATLLAASGATIEVIDKKNEDIKKRAEDGDTEAQWQLGVLYINGTGISVDMREGIKWLKIAADAGSSNAMFFLGSVYLTGKNGIAVDMPKAFTWIQRSAALGYAPAINALRAGT